MSGKEVFSPRLPQFMQPDGQSIFERDNYSAAVKAGGLVFIAGQVGIEANGTIPSDPVAQFSAVFENLRGVLAEAGCGLSDVIELISYHVGLRDHLTAFAQVKQSYLPSLFPTWTFLEVSALARPAFLVEVKAIARVRAHSP